MKGLFGFMDMADNYADRKVGRYEQDDLLVSTCLVTDADKPYETAVAHPEYNNGTIVIVETYDTKHQARIGHDKWLAKMTASELPESISDNNCCDVGKAFAGRTFKRVKQA